MPGFPNPFSDAENLVQAIGGSLAGAIGGGPGEPSASQAIPPGFLLPGQAPATNPNPVTYSNGDSGFLSWLNAGRLATLVIGVVMLSAGIFALVHPNPTTVIKGLVP